MKIEKIIVLTVLINSFLLASHNHENENHMHDENSSLESFLHNTALTKDYINNMLVSLSTNLDNYLTLNPNSKDINKKSFAHLEFYTYKEEGKGIETKARIKVRLKLPKLQDKLRVVIGNEDNQKNNYNDYSSATTKADDYNVGLEYKSSTKKLFKYKASLGLNIHSGFDPYVKLRISKDFPFTELFQTKTKQEFKYSHDDKFESKTSLEFIKDLNNKFVLSNYNEYRYEEIDTLNTVYNAIKLNQQLTTKSYIGYIASVTFNDENSDNINTREYQTYVSYRYFIRGWLYYDIVPKVLYKDEDNYEPKFALRLNLGMFIGKDIK